MDSHPESSEVDSTFDESEVQHNSDNAIPASHNTPANNPKVSISRTVQYVRKFFADKKIKAPRLRLKPKIVKPFVKLSKTPEIDDRQHILQDGIKLLSKSDSELDVKDTLNNAAVALLHNSQRTPPGSGNQVYARKVVSSLAPNALPEVDQVFKVLLESKQAVSHPNGVSSLTFALGSLISMSLFRTSKEDPSRNETSPYLDLSPLYGSNGSESDSIRLKDGRGMLAPDCFYEERTVLLPKAVSALLILFNRNHNHIAKRLLDNYVGKTTGDAEPEKAWIDPSEVPPTPDGSLDGRLAVQDDAIFRTARLINCGHFRNIVMEDFLKGLLGLPSVGPSACLNILANIEGCEKGKGLDTNVESSLLYQWSGSMSQGDTEHVKQSLEGILLEPLDNISPDDFENALETARSHVDPRRRRRNYAGLSRGKDDRFKDDELARVLQDATADLAAAPGSGIPSFMRPSEMNTIEQARKWNVCSLNEYRKFLGLKPYKSFKEWNPDPKVAEAAQKLYKSIDQLELYPGLQAEEVTPDSGFRFGYTMNYALSVDLVSRIRSDPKLTTEFTPANLTPWGFEDCELTPENGAFGAMLPRILQRNLPRSYPYDSIYCLFPFSTPDITKKHLSLMPDLSLNVYRFDKPEPNGVHVLVTTQTISHVFNRPAVYPTGYSSDLKKLTNGYGYFLGFDNERLHDVDQMMTLYALIPDAGALSRYGAWFGKAATEYIKDRSKARNGSMSIDIIRDVINATCTRWVCETLCDQELSNDSDKEAQAHEEFAALYAYVFRNVEPEKGWAVRALALRTSKTLQDHIQSKIPVPTHLRDNTYLDYLHVTVKDAQSFILRIKKEFAGMDLPRQTALTFLDKLLKSSRSIPLGDIDDFPDLKELRAQGGGDEYQQDRRLEEARIVANVLGLAVVTAVNYAQACAQAVDFYLDDKYTTERREIIRLCKSNDPHSNARIMGYIREAQRLGQPLGLWREVAEDAIIPGAQGSQGLAVRKGDRIYADFSKAHLNRNEFQNPETVDPTRKTPSIQGLGLHKCPGITFVDQTMPEMFKAIFRLEGLCRAPSSEGRLVRVSHPDAFGVDSKPFLGADGVLTYYPRSMVLHYNRGDKSSQESIAKKRKKKWKISSLVRQRGAGKRWIIDRAMSALVVLFLLWILMNMFSAIWSHLPRFRRRPRKPKAPLPPVQHLAVECPEPFTQFQPWDTTTIRAGPDGEPIPIEYTLDHPTAHSVSIVDVDRKDMRMSVWVDDVLRGLTSEFEMDKGEECADDYGLCLRKQFSAGYVVISPGKHTVRIQWEGKEFVNGSDSGEVDWGDERGRRFGWMREYCAA